MRTRITLLTLLITSLSLFSACQKPSPELTAAELLNLGEKYLLELDYEQALVKFLNVIEIEPMNPRGYTGAAEAYVGIERVEDAVAILEKGLEKTADKSIKEMLDSLVEDAEDKAEVTPTPTEEPMPIGEQEPMEEELATFEGVIISNWDEYSEQFGRYKDQYQNTNTKPQTIVYILPFGVRFNDVIETEIDENVASIGEAELNYTLISTHEGMSELCGIPMKMTGYFSINERTEELSGPVKRGSAIGYDYRPNGDYVFTCESYEPLED